MKTVRITQGSGCEFNHTFETEVANGLEPIVLSADNEGFVYQVKTTGGFEEDPASQESLVETYIVPAPTPGIAESGQFSIDVTSLVAGDINVRFNDRVPIVPVTLAGSETASQIYDLIIAATPTGWTSTNNTTNIVIANDLQQVNTLKIAISPGTTGIVVTESAYTTGLDPVSNFLPGTVSVYLNSAEATEVELLGTENLAGIYEKIGRGLGDQRYGASWVGNISILKVAAGANVIPLSIDLGATGLTKDTSVLTPGEDAHRGNAKASSVKIQYSIDTRQAINASTAVWTDIETFTNGTTYKENSKTGPVSALRFFVLTPAVDSVAQILIRTAK